MASVSLRVVFLVSALTATNNLDKLNQIVTNSQHSAVRRATMGVQGENAISRIMLRNNAPHKDPISLGVRLPPPQCNVGKLGWTLTPSASRKGYNGQGWTSLCIFGCHFLSNQPSQNRLKRISCTKQATVTSLLRTQHSYVIPDCNYCRSIGILKVLIIKSCSCKY